MGRGTHLMKMTLKFLELQYIVQGLKVQNFIRLIHTSALHAQLLQKMYWKYLATGLTLLP
jgi:hypothetical protein